MSSEAEAGGALTMFVLLLVVGLVSPAALGYVMGGVLGVILLGRFLILPYVALHRIFDWDSRRDYVEPPDRLL